MTVDDARKILGYNKDGISNEILPLEILKRTPEELRAIATLMEYYKDIEENER